MKQGDIIIYGCVIIGAGIGLSLDHAFPGALIGLGAGYLLKIFLVKKNRCGMKKIIVNDRISTYRKVGLSVDTH
ncbi:hypothetical protein AAHB61_13960 [Bacillus cereus]